MIAPGDAPSIQWFLNPYHGFRARRLRAIRIFAGALFSLVVVCFVALGFLGSRLSSGAQGGLAATAFLSLLLSCMSIPFAFPKFRDQQASASPVRVGLSEVGIHIEYDERGTATLTDEGWAARLIRWDAISDVSPETVLWGRPTNLAATQKDTGRLRWRIVELSPELVDRVLAAWKARTSVLQ